MFSEHPVKQIQAVTVREAVLKDCKSSSELVFVGIEKTALKGKLSRRQGKTVGKPTLVIFEYADAIGRVPLQRAYGLVPEQDIDFLDVNHRPFFLFKFLLIASSSREVEYLVWLSSAAISSK